MKTEERIRAEFESFVKRGDLNADELMNVLSRDEESGVYFNNVTLGGWVSWHACQYSNNTALAEKDAEIARLREALKEIAEDWWGVNHTEIATKALEQTP